MVDEAVIDALYLASQAGVPVELNIRGICCLKPGVPGVSENIVVRSVVGRFLEHSRIYQFGGDGNPEYWIGSADLMHRNLDRRVEVLCNVTDPGCAKQLRGQLDLAFAPETAAWEMQPDGSWLRTGDQDYQELLMHALADRSE